MSLRLKSDRREESRDDSSDRRQLPRPPLWLNLFLLLLAVGIGALAIGHRRYLDTKYENVIRQRQTSPLEVNELQSELAAMDLTEEELRAELESRLEYEEQLKSDDFYIAIDTEQKKLLFHYGDRVLREAPVEIGRQLEIENGRGDSWTFVPLKGAFRVVDKDYQAQWKVPEWVYLMNGEEAPDEPTVIGNGIGRYVVELPHDYLIHSPPADDSPLEGAAPGSFMVQEADLRAIWPRIEKGTNVYIF